MLRIIENPAATLEEAFAFIRSQLVGQLPSGPDSDVLLALLEMSHRAGALWAAALIRNEIHRPGDKRAPCVAVEKIIAQACPPAPAGASN